MKQHRTSDSMGVGIVLIGIGVMVLLRGIISPVPWILGLIAVASLPSALRRKHGWAAWQSFYWLMGLAILFSTGLLWPGILVLAGGSMLLPAFAHEGKPVEEEIVAEPVTVIPVEPVVVAEESASVEDEPTANRGTSPLSRADIDELEAELAAAVEGPRPIEVETVAGVTTLLEAEPPVSEDDEEPAEQERPDDEPPEEPSVS